MGKMYRLLLALNTEDADMEVLRKYGKVKDGITREVLVPEYTTLQSLHYIIQRAFGWQNTHLHHFELPYDKFHEVVGEKFMSWVDYCGVYFRFPLTDEEDEDEMYEDADSFSSVKSYLHHMYVDPSRYDGIAGHFMEDHTHIMEFLEKNSDVLLPPIFSGSRWSKPEKKSAKEMTIREAQSFFAEGGGLNCLTERLSVSEILGTGTPMEPKDIRIIYNALYNIYGRMRYMSGRNSRFDYLLDLRYLLKDTDFEVEPITKEIRYCYDYGDGWEVCVRLLEVAAGEDSPKPVCVAMDGLPVMDDVGGVPGYCDFLLGINGLTPDSPAEMKEWAREMGWTGRVTKPSTLL